MLVVRKELAGLTVGVLQFVCLGYFSVEHWRALVTILKIEYISLAAVVEGANAEIEIILDKTWELIFSLQFMVHI